VLHQPSGHPINALFRIVFSRNEQTGNFCPDIGFIVQIDERVQYGLEMGGADPMIKVLRNPFKSTFAASMCRKILYGPLP
jgi:hypothetical protein